MTELMIKLRLSNIIPDDEIEDFRFYLQILKHTRSTWKDRGYIRNVKAVENAVGFFEEIDDSDKWKLAFTKLNALKIAAMKEERERWEEPLPEDWSEEKILDEDGYEAKPWE